MHAGASSRSQPDSDLHAQDRTDFKDRRRSARNDANSCVEKLYIWVKWPPKRAKFCRRFPRAPHTRTRPESISETQTPRGAKFRPNSPSHRGACLGLHLPSTPNLSSCGSHCPGTNLWDPTYIKPQASTGRNGLPITAFLDSRQRSIRPDLQRTAMAILRSNHKAGKKKTAS